jgi:xylulokinase
MEGITLQNYDLLVYLKEAKLPIDRIRIIGGPTKSEIWNRMQADVYGLPVETTDNPEAGTLGAAILAGCGAGEFGSIGEAVQEMVRVKSVYEPHPENSGVYQELYAVYREAFTSLEDGRIFSNLSQLQAKL